MSAKKTNFSQIENQRLRAYSRAYINGQVFIHNDNHLYIAPLNNISAGGLFVDKLCTLAEGSPVRVVVKSSKFPTPIQAKGNIVRVQKAGKSGLAVEFTSINQKAREVIQAVVFQNKLETAMRIA